MRGRRGFRVTAVGRRRNVGAGMQLDGQGEGKTAPHDGGAIVEVLRPHPARWDSTIERHSDSPMPMPSALVEKKASYRRPITSSGRPGPVSVTLNSMTPPSSGVWRGTTRSSMLRRAGGQVRGVDRLGGVLQQVQHTCSIRIGSTMSTGRCCAT
jgi:hypothetical protein